MVNIDAPYLLFRSGWRKVIGPGYRAIEHGGYNVQEAKLTSLLVLYIGLEPDTIPSLDLQKMVCVAIVFWGDTFEDMEDIPKERYEGDQALLSLNGSSRHDRTPLGDVVKNIGRDVAIEKIRRAKDVKELIDLISPTKQKCAWSLEHVTDGPDGGTFVFQLPPACTHASEVIKWVEFAVGFVRAALHPGQRYYPNRRTIRDLHRFVAFGQYHAEYLDGLPVDDPVRPCMSG